MTAMLYVQNLMAAIKIHFPIFGRFHIYKHTYKHKFIFIHSFIKLLLQCKPKIDPNKLINLIICKVNAETECSLTFYDYYGK